MSNEKVVKRLHVSGLAQSATARDVAARFSSFGQVVDGEAGVVGLVPGRTFCFLSLETTDAQYKRCLSLFNGSMWKGSKLRISLATPDYKARLASEREEQETSRKKKRRKQTDADGKQAPNFEFVTSENVKAHPGWVLDNDVLATPLFPIIIRPLHPLPAPRPKAAQTGWTRAKPSKEVRAALRQGIALEPPTRANRVRIDPRRWGRKKIIFTESQLSSLPLFGSNGYWECEETSSTDKVEWIFKKKDGSVLRREEVQLTRRLGHTDRFAALLDGLEQAVDETQRQERPRSASPPPYVPVAPRALIYNEEDAFALATVALEGEELEQVRQKERLGYMDMLQNILGETFAKPEVKEEKFEGFADYSDDDDAIANLKPTEQILRLRGGAASSDSSEPDSDSDSSSSSSDSSSSDDSDSDSDSSENDSDDSSSSGSSSKSIKNQKSSVPAVQSNVLKHMFQPQEGAASFSLVAGFGDDIELEELEEIIPEPPVAVEPIPKPQPFIPRFTATQTKAPFSSGPYTPFFVFPGGNLEKKNQVDLEQAALIGLDETRVSAATRESKAWIADAAAGFYRTQTLEDIELEHQKMRDALKGVARKRHREAVKKAGREKKIKRFA